MVSASLSQRRLKNAQALTPALSAASKTEWVSRTLRPTGLSITTVIPAAIACNACSA